MRAEIVAIGTEILLGQIADTNAQWISRRLAEIGVDVLHHQAVGDDVERIGGAISLACTRADVVIATGGLGPTQDDVTRQALSELAAAPLERRPELEERLRARWAATGREMPPSNLVQADVPRGARVIEPVRGTAPGLILEVRGVRVYALPGVPAEMQEMMEGAVLPELADLAGPATLLTRTLRCVGMAESKIAETLEDLFVGTTNPTIAYLAGGGEVQVRISAKATSRDAAEALIAPVAEEVRRRLGEVVYGEGEDTLEAVVVGALVGAGLTLAAAESLTGGGLGARITAVPGASAAFLGSAVTYDPRAKVAVLGVSEATLREHGPVSRACAAEMAAGARRLFGADLAVALTGAAGPEPHGGAEPGVVWVALEAGSLVHVRSLRWPGDRAFVRRLAEQAALDLIRRHLAGLPLPP